MRNQLKRHQLGQRSYRSKHLSILIAKIGQIFETKGKEAVRKIHLFFSLETE